MKISSSLVWRLFLIVLVLILLAEVGFVWFSGKKETVEAFADGRRLLISLDSGIISGKINSSAPEEEEEVKKTEAEEVNPASEATVTAETETSEKTEPIPQPAEVDNAEIINTISEAPEEKTDELPQLPISTSPTADFSTALTAKGEFGAMPAIAGDGSKPWKYYAKKSETKYNKPIIAVIVTGLGVDKNISEQALRLPDPITLSFSPYAKSLNEWAKSARISGHELLLDLPMEASNYPASDPGPLGLLISTDQNGNETKIKKIMSQSFGYVGFLTPRDEIFTGNTELLKSLLQIFSTRGLAVVIGKPPPKNETLELIEKGNTASVISDTLIDEELTTSSIDARLSLLEQIAKKNGYAVGIAQPYPITIKQLAIWAEKAEKNGFILVPVSAVIAKHFS